MHVGTLFRKPISNQNNIFSQIHTKNWNRSLYIHAMPFFISLSYLRYISHFIKYKLTNRYKYWLIICIYVKYNLVWRNLFVIRNDILLSHLQMSKSNWVTKDLNLTVKFMHVSSFNFIIIIIWNNDCCLLI